MLSNGSPAPFPESQVAVCRAGKPRMRREDSAPMLPELHIQRLGLTEFTTGDQLLHLLGGLSHHMVIADIHPGVHLARPLPQLLRVLQRGRTDRLLDDDSPGSLVQRLKREGKVGFRRSTDEDVVEAAGGSLLIKKEPDAVVPLTVSGWIDLELHPLERGGTHITDGDLPTHPAGCVGEVIPDRPRAIDLDPA